MEGFLGQTEGVLTSHTQGCLLRSPEKTRVCIPGFSPTAHHEVLLASLPHPPPDCCCCGTQPQAPHASEGSANLWQRPPHIKFSFSICTIQRHLMNPPCSTIIAILFQNISISPKGNLVPMAASPFPLVLNPGSHQSALGLPSSGILGISQK